MNRYPLITRKQRQTISECSPRQVYHPIICASRKVPSALLTRNMPVEKGLIKNTRVIVHQLHQRTIEIWVINRAGDVRDIHYLPRIRFDFQPPNTLRTVQRLQFPLKLAYATTFHSYSGLTLDRSVLDLREPKCSLMGNFTQLYPVYVHATTHIFYSLTKQTILLETLYIRNY